jgi:hypothetical protein
MAKGNCGYCRQRFAGSRIKQHLQECSKRSEGDSGEVLLLRAWAGPYWVYFEVNADSTLRDVDGFLRELWLECCDHLSAFTIDEEHYNSDEAPMDTKVGDVVQLGAKFLHEYDFGSTTRLQMECIEKRQGSAESISVVARNDPPKVKCGCKKAAEDFCTECETLLCGSCGEKHKCGDEMLSPVVNSPRAGVCGYDG